MKAKVRIDINACLGHKDCITVCPEEVFGWRKPPEASLALRLKLLIESRGYQAYVENEAACTACRMCVSVCPEGAIEVDAVDLDEAGR